jgi:hypothetical protein
MNGEELSDIADLFTNDREVSVQFSFRGLTVNTGPIDDITTFDMTKFREGCWPLAKVVYA